MGEKLHKKTFILIAFIGLLNVQINAQETFSSGFNGWSNAYGNSGNSGAVTHLPSGGEAGDGALQLARVDNNSNFGLNPAGIDANVINYIKIKYQNNSNATSFRVQGSSTAGTLTNTVFSITAASSTWVTKYLDVGGITNWSGTLDNLDILVRGGYAVGEGVMIVDEIEFVATLPGLATNFAEYVGAEGADDENPGTINPASDGHEEVTAWHFAANANVEFSDTQSYEGDYSIKISAPAATSSGWFYFSRDSGTHPTAADKSLADAGTHLMLLNVFVESGSPDKVRVTIAKGTPASNINVDFNTSGLELGKWHTLVTEISPDDIVTTMQLNVNLFNTNASSAVVYMDGIEFLSLTAGEYITSIAGASWADDTTWSGVQPLATDVVYIKNNVKIWDADEVAKKVFISDSNSLTFKNSVPSLTTEELHTGISGLVIIEPGSSLIVTGKSSGNGNITYDRTLDFVTGNANGWYLIGSPVAGQVYNDAYATTNGLATSGTNRGIGTYDDTASIGSKWSYLQNTDSNSGTFISGAGYTMKRESATGEVSFTGSINTDAAGISPTISSGNNLLAVPYTSYVNSKTFLEANTNLDQQIWLWKHEAAGGGNYEVKVAGDTFILAPGQGFFVKANSGTSVNFAKTNQMGNTDTFQRSSRTEVKLLMNDGENNRFAKIYYLDGATNSFDNGWEGEVFEGVENSVDVFTQLVENNEGKSYQVQSLPNSNLEAIIVPVGVKAEAGKEITFSAEALNLPTDMKVFLEDKQENTFVRLDEVNAEYSVTLSENLDGIGRFYIHTSRSALSIDDTILNTISIYKSSENTLRVTGLSQGNTTVKLFNVLGEQILSNSFSTNNGVQDVHLPKLATGVYITQVETEAGKINKKIILE